MPLQFGHAGEGVETGSGADSTTFEPSRLQFGHAGEGVETRRSPHTVSSQDHGFNSATPVKAWRRQRYYANANLYTELQFGHAGEGVETSKGGFWEVLSMWASIRPRR